MYGSDTEINKHKEKAADFLLGLQFNACFENEREKGYRGVRLDYFKRFPNG